MSFNDERELAGLPARIEELEARIGAIRGRFADPALYRDAGDEVKALRAELAGLEADLAAAYARWEELEARADPWPGSNRAKPGKRAAEAPSGLCFAHPEPRTATAVPRIP